MRLNLGCGNDIREGYVNVDFRQIDPRVVIVDLSKFPWPFEDQSADEILMLDLLEHFPYAQTKLILLECYRVLRSDGTVVIQVPDMEILASVFVGDTTTQYLPFQCNRCGCWLNTATQDGSCQGCGQTLSDIREAAMMRLFGGQNYPGNWHHTCFTKQMLTEKAASVGLELLSDEDQEQQAPNWNFKMRFRKGDIWRTSV